MVSELSELPHTFQSNLGSEKALVQAHFDKYKYNMEKKMTKIKNKWVRSFKEMKSVLFKSI